MPVTRMRMRPWLEKMIDSDTIPGLTWVDKERTMFTIPWKHAARHGWELEKDASLFKEWAIHTGKYVHGQTCDPKTWKANFRCAMNSLPDIKEVKDKSINKGHQAMRVFRMLPVTPKSRDKRSKAKETKTRKKSLMIKEEDTESSSDTQSSVDESMLDDTPSTQENTVDSTVNTEPQELTLIASSEVPDWCMSIEIGEWNSAAPLNHRFEVSPVHSSGKTTSPICEQLEIESPWIGSLGLGVLSNESRTTSPGSHWSDASSVEELEDIPRYTTLGSDFQNYSNSFWNNFC
uniref:Interferon regulatory factor n=1 Tax=Mola mola TaxID=94237 RepID=A0A3Q4BFH9_MOLML